MSLKIRSHPSSRSGGLLGQSQTKSRLANRAALLAALLVPCSYVAAQVAAEPSASATAPAKDDEVIVLSPFEVSADANNGYNATTTLAGNRLNTNLRDVGSSVSVYTSQFIKDIGATNNTSLLQYTISSEVGGIYGNFAGTGDGAALSEPDRPSQATRVRGLAVADNTRDFFLSQIPWDSYNIERVDLQRGPNAILFGEGSPAGIINAGTKSATFKNGGEAEVRVGSYGSTRESVGYNQVLLPKQLAVRFDLLNDNEKYEQKPAFSRDRRASGSIRFEPEMLNRNGFRFIVKAGFETGKIDSNNPRELPPQDQITPFFGTGAAGTNQATYNGWQLWDHQTGRIGNGALRDPKGTVYANAGGMVIPYIQYWLSTSPGGNNPVALFGNGGGAQTGYWIQSATNAFTKTTIGGLTTQPGSWATIANTSLWATNSNLDYSAAGVFKNNVLTDPSIFNFYKKLIDGDTKHETQQFHRGTFNVAETALDDQVGISFDYNKESYKYTHTALLGGNVALYIDPMAVYNNGTPGAGLTGVPFSDGTPNPNVGRPFVSTTGGSNYSNETKSEDKRVTAFATRDLRKDLPGWIGRILGKHTVTGLWADSTQTTDNRNWDSYGYLDPNAYTLQDNPSLNPALSNFTSVRPTMDIYLGSSLLGKSAKGANIPVISGIPKIATGTVTYFNDTWNAPASVDPTAQWTNNAYTLDPTKLAPGYVTAAGGTIVNGVATGIVSPTSFKQSDNPANYVGWTTKSLSITQAADSAANRDALTTNAALNQAETISKALVWQGKMLDDSLVATFGWRTDTARSYGYSRTIGNGTDVHAIDFSNYSIPSAANAVITVSSRSESLVAHLMDLPGIKDVTKNLPFEVSLSYNQSSNFQPIAGRFDVLGQAIAAPSGKTIDRGILIETRDGKYSLKISKYVTSEKNITNASSGSFGNHFGWWMNQLGYFTNRYDRSLASYDATSKAGAYSSLINYTNPDGSVNAAYLATEDAAVAGVRAFQNAIDPRFWQAWGYPSLAQVQSGGPYSQNVAVPNGFTLTEDSISKGYEIELNANPIPNWRITFNASKENAVRSNIGGAAMSKIMSQALAMVQGPGGMMHFWWGTPDVPYAKDTFYLGDFHTFSGPGTDFAGFKVLEGAAAPELRTWHYNLITNYDFTHNFLKGFNVGGGMRYESGATIGYPVIGDPNSPATDSYDVAHPYKGPSETYFDGWIGYSRNLTHKIKWHIQLNGTNLFKGNYLIPVTVQGPIPGQAAGTPAGYRIGPSQQYTLTNRFEF